MNRRHDMMEAALAPPPQEYAPSPAPPPAASQAPAEEGYVAELEQLAKLRQSGIITDEEFEAKKKQILGI